MLKKVKELAALREKARMEIELRGAPKEIQITVHMGTCGIAAGARDILDRLADEIYRADLRNVTLRQSGCLGLCDQEPMLTLRDTAGSEYRYGRLDGEKVEEIVRRHIINGSVVDEYLIKA